MEQPMLHYKSILPGLCKELGLYGKDACDENGVTTLQREFWGIVREETEIMEADLMHVHSPVPVRQFYLELKVWRRLCK
jgi:hypothetical protein